MDDCLFRVLLSGASQQDWIRRQWRTLQPGAVEGDSGVHLIGGVCCDCQPDFPARAVALEPCCCGPLSGGSRLFRVYETVVKLVRDDRP